MVAVCNERVAAATPNRRFRPVPPALRIGGRTAQAWFELVDGGDDAARLRFVQDHLSDDIAPGWTDERKVADIAGIQDDLDGTSIVEIAEEDPLTFHVTLERAGGDTVVASVEAGEADPTRMVCNAFTEWGEPHVAAGSAAVSRRGAPRPSSGHRGRR